MILESMLTFFESLNGSKIWRGIDELTSLTPFQALPNPFHIHVYFDRFTAGQPYEPPGSALPPATDINDCWIKLHSCRVEV